MNSGPGQVLPVGSDSQPNVGAVLVFRSMRSVCLLFVVRALAIAWPVLFTASVEANHQGHAGQNVPDSSRTVGPGYSIPGASFQVFLGQGKEPHAGQALDRAQADAAVQTVIDAFTVMVHHRTDYPRFDESLKKEALQRVIVESSVVNQEGKEFPFLVARTKEPGKVILLISASSLKEKDYLHHPDQLVPVLAREFQWVVSKADTAPKAKSVVVERDLAHALVRPDQDILSLSPDDRLHVLQGLFENYLRTMDDQNSLNGQSYYEVGSTTSIAPTHPDSTTKLYDIRVREALQKIVHESYFAEKTPQAVRSLLNGKIWNVAFVKIDQRDWATRTRVLPDEKAVLVGAQGQRIQPASILVNTYRMASPDDPFYSDTRGLPMGALSADQLARVIASEIQHNIHEKSLSGHVAQDALSAP
ncbi:MAG: hypothetical protein R3B37_08955 [Nitrospira sp.]|nr:hypothetical protein [Nitrospira sp.]